MAEAVLTYDSVSDAVVVVLGPRIVRLLGQKYELRQPNGMARGQDGRAASHLPTEQSLSPHRSRAGRLAALHALQLAVHRRRRRRSHCLALQPHGHRRHGGCG